ncbi:MAG: protein translocase subunit SecF [Hyphomicrobiales bacterium]|nr:protein translocase subunit SecF [Hyphomicrobiales bacterium]
MFRGFRIIPSNTKIPFLAGRRICFALSIVLVLGSIGLLVVKGLNLGIDFQGGILLEVRTSGPANIAEMRGTLSDLKLGEVTLQEFGSPDTILIRLQRQEGGEEAQQAAVVAVKGALGSGIEYRRSEVVGPQVSEELLWDGIFAVTASMLAIMAYIWFRFEWQFGLCGVIALMHDVITALGLLSLLGIEFNLASVAAILTIAGYSINDTVVIFDRIRENLRRYKKMAAEDVMDLSLNGTLPRTIMTSFTTLLTLFALDVLGGEVLRGFSLALIWGIGVGTYSSICIATPLLLTFKIRRSSVAQEEPQTASSSEPL